MARFARTSVKRLRRLRNEAGAQPDALRVFPRRAPINYAAYCFARRVLIFGPYEHALHADARAPRLHVELSDAGAFGDFWRAEFDSMTGAGHADVDAWIESLS
jgi:hypothetical protein